MTSVQLFDAKWRIVAIDWLPFLRGRAVKEHGLIDSVVNTFI